MSTQSKYSTSTERPYGIVAAHEGSFEKPTSAFTNQQGQITITPRGTWLCVWTRGSAEAAPDHTIAVARSTDEGRTWSKPSVVEQASADGVHLPSWIIPFTVPHTGRVYVFYWCVTEAGHPRESGRIFLRYSDDDGLTWSDRQILPMPFHAGIDEQGAAFHGWNYQEPRIMPNREVVFTFSKIRPSTIDTWLEKSMLIFHGEDPATGHAKVWQTQAFLMVATNLLSETDASKLNFEIRPEGENGIHMKYPAHGFPCGDEMSVVPLSTGEWLVTFRAPVGHMYSAISADHGRTWSEPEPLRYCPDGPLVLQPNAAEPLIKLQDGRFILLFHNNDGSANFGYGPWDHWRVRTPMWVMVGRELRDAKGPTRIVWKAPQVVIDNHCVQNSVQDSPEKYGCRTDVNYPQFFEYNGRYFITYCNRKLDILINEIDPAFLDDFGLPC